MPRVYRSIDQGRAKSPRRCAACGQPLQKGDPYYSWARFRSPAQYQHVACGYPRASQLSGAKTAVVDDAVADASQAIAEWNLDRPEPNEEGLLEADIADLKAALEGPAEEARNVASEYSDGADNMPESLQYGAQAEAMRDVGERLESWADELEGWEPSIDTSCSPEDWDDMVEALRGEAEEHLTAEDVPVYEG